MGFFKKLFKHSPSQKCAINQPLYERIERIDVPLRQSSMMFVQTTKAKKQQLSIMVNLLVEIADLINKLERRLYCFMTELERTKTNPSKYMSLRELYNNMKASMSEMMTTFSYLREEEPLQQVSDEFVLNVYLMLLRELREMGFQLLKYVSIQQNMQSLNYRYQYEKETIVPKCFSKPYPEVADLMIKGKPNSQINKRKYQLISECVKNANIQAQCVQMYDAGLASGSRDVFIMQAFMRIELLLHTIRKERRKITIPAAIQQNIEKQEAQIDNRVFRQLKKLTQGSAMLPRETIVLQNRKCVPIQQQKHKQA